MELESRRLDIEESKVALKRDMFHLEKQKYEDEALARARDREELTKQRAAEQEQQRANTAILLEILKQLKK